MGSPYELDLGGLTIVAKEFKGGSTAPGNASTVATTTAGGSTLTLTRAAHLGRTILLDTGASTTITLPASAGTGDTYHFLVTTSGAHVIKVANGTDVMVGVIFIGSASAQACAVDVASSTDDTLTMNATTTGGIAGGYVDMVDAVSGKWYVSGILASSGTAASGQFSATVS